MKSGLLDDVSQQLGSVGKQIGQAVAGAPKSAAKTVAAQIGFEVKEGQQKPPKEMAGKAKKDNADFVKELYGATPNQKPPEQAQNPQKSPEEIQQMMALRQKLHGDYYQKLITPNSRPEEAQQEQEREQERMERLKMEDLQEKKKEDEKKKPIAVLQAERKTEAPLGAG